MDNAGIEIKNINKTKFKERNSNSLNKRERKITKEIIRKSERPAMNCFVLLEVIIR